MRIYYSFILLVFLAFSCSPKQSKTKITEMQFVVDSLLIEKKEIDKQLQISYNPPKGWKQNDSLFNKIKSTINKNDLAYPIKIKKLFWNEASQSVMTIGVLNNISAEKLNHILSNYEEFFNPQKQWKSIKKAEFIYKNFWVNQFLLQNKNIINFKLIFQTQAKDFFEVNYVIPSSQYKKIMKNVESSIGSFNS